VSEGANGGTIHSGSNNRNLPDGLSAVYLLFTVPSDDVFDLEGKLLRLATMISFINKGQRPDRQFGQQG